MSPVVCIDPGHGGKDPGAIGPSGLKEKDVNLVIAQGVKKHLESNAEVMLTRMKDEYVNLVARAAMANKASAALFVSIHCNAAANQTANGVEIIHHRDSERGQKLARTLMNYLTPATELKNRGVKPDERGLAVLRLTEMPAVIIEVGFISNPIEEKLMKDAQWLDRVAHSIANGVTEYLKGAERL